MLRANKNIEAIVGRIFEVRKLFEVIYYFYTVSTLWLLLHVNPTKSVDHHDIRVPISSDTVTMQMAPKVFVHRTNLCTHIQYVGTHMHVITHKVKLCLFWAHVQFPSIHTHARTHRHMCTKRQRDRDRQTKKLTKCR